MKYNASFLGAMLLLAVPMGAFAQVSTPLGGTDGTSPAPVTVAPTETPVTSPITTRGFADRLPCE